MGQRDRKVSNMKKLVTISREYGSGGRIIGRLVAEKLGIPFYDKEILDMAAEQSGLSREIVEAAELRAKSSFSYSLASAMNFGEGMIGDTVSINEKLFVAQYDVVHQIAEAGEGVIVGRCADYVLRDYPNCLKVFVSDSHENRVNRITNEYGAETKKVDDLIIKTDKKRANYYSFHTNLTWGDCTNYDLCVRTGSFGMDGAADMIIDALELKLGRKVRP